MSEWTKPRKCERCGNTFEIADHGHEAAANAAKALEDSMRRPGDWPNDADGYAPYYCPSCKIDAMADGINKQMELSRTSPLLTALKRCGFPERLVWKVLRFLAVGLTCTWLSSFFLKSVSYQKVAIGCCLLAIIFWAFPFCLELRSNLLSRKEFKKNNKP
jgi:hypothetical protein